MRAVDDAATARGVPVRRVDLRFRSLRRRGPPHPADQPRDREGLADDLASFAAECGRPVWIAGHSYGGRMASMLAAERPAGIAGLLLLGYPLHPPRKPETPRTAHWPELNVPLIFVSGARDAFGSPDAFRSAFALLPSSPTHRVIPSAGHDLRVGRGDDAFDASAAIILDTWFDALRRR